MVVLPDERPRRVLIASSHPLFGEGLRRLLRERYAERVEIVGVVTDPAQLSAAVSALAPDVVVIDYDTGITPSVGMSAEDFVACLVAGRQPMRVVVLSLRDTHQAVVYDRRLLAAAQVEDWVDA
jgi:DNA-binding NarL/FixJ family response regulator